ncbi:MAG TPA: hypothetical protein VEL69_09340 [Ktedonobacteraceae bacterium]|nr:hypothetical protein [Ktedonobacteraceae bacterium]
MLNTLLETPRKRPLLITIMALLLALQGAVWLVLGVLAFIGVITNGKIDVLGAASDIASLDVLSVTWLVSAVAALFFSWALWTLKRWAFWATLIIELGNILAGTLLLIRPNPLYPYSLGEIVVSMIIAIIVLVFFLVDAKVRQAFGI